MEAMPEVRLFFHSPQCHTSPSGLAATPAVAAE